MHRLLLLVLLLVPACSSPPEAAAPAPTASTPTAEMPTAEMPTASPFPAGVTVVAGSSGPVAVEVADDDQERAVGLMRRTGVPAGTGMVFLYDEAAAGRFYMFDVQVPLTAVFAREGRVVGVVDMPPCPRAQPQDCPTYGPDAAFDTVLETAPETLAGKVAVGDALEVRGSAAATA